MPERSGKLYMLAAVQETGGNHVKKKKKVAQRQPAAWRVGVRVGEL